jgi:putative aldouronate transport system substrate-binding protein
VSTAVHCRVPAGRGPWSGRGLFSDTWSRKQGQLGTIVNDGQNEILSGRKPVSSWDDVLATWKSAGGDQVRRQYEEALQRGSG